MPATRKRTRATRSAAEGRAMRAAVSHGQEMAEKAIRSREAKKRLRLRGPSPGVVIAEGDSWFDYPFFDILERLEDSFNFEIESVAHKGDTVESMAYDASQSTTLARMFEKIGRLPAAGHPRAILLSGGGNDIAGDEFAILLNHAASGLPPLNDQVAAGIIDVRLKAALVSVISGVTALARHYFQRLVPVVIHGYGHAVPDGRGYLGGAWILPGPWLKPGFTQKGYPDLATNARLVADLIDRFNAMLQTLPTTPGLGHVTYIDLRKIVKSDPAIYKKWWNDELHPTKSGFEAVAAEFARVIMGFPAPGAGAPRSRRSVRPRSSRRAGAGRRKK